MTSLDTTSRSGADTFARYAMVASAFLMPLLFVLLLVTAPPGVTEEGQPYVQNFYDNLGSYPMQSWISALAMVLTVPALFGVARVARAGRPALGLVGMIMAFSLALPLSGNTDDTLYAASKAGLDVTTATRLYNAEMNDLPTSPLGLVWFAGLLGLVILGVAVLLGRTGPAWAAITLIVAPFLVPVAWFAGLGNVFAAIAWAALAAGMGGVSLGLLKR
ncbi:hypothetical protein ACIBH1_07140 [Nonomuraea sp. NPDC050663]|uniref:hypothetical protein n=1 Tax=Nonomuraea sp. NPDC050663 TaxID=3364370 RepID=UPI00379648F8